MSRSPDPLPTSAFDYELPARLIARYPAQLRDESRLLILDRTTDTIEHKRFRDLPALLPAGDALVLNETRVLPARLIGKRGSGGRAEVLLLHPAPIDNLHARDWVALVRPGAKLGPGRTVVVSEDLRVEILSVSAGGARVVRLHSTLSVPDALARFGRIPLPPYIDRAAEPADAERYQTVYARTAGSVAAPTAGLHFTDSLLGQIGAAGVHIVRVLLHVGAGTFRPVEMEDPSQHVMHEEAYAVSDEAALELNQVRASGGRVWAVGTTVARTLETVCNQTGNYSAGSGWTRLFIRSPHRFHGVDHLITNFHLPRSTLLMLVAAFAGYERLMRAYHVAIAQEYRFYSYGDAMVVV
ncbi:MAG: tRNA preQ1(34) S-adenosylmethionine ribosyltransferase-isomerase QueA [Longimicrobiales bacterium]